MDKNSWITAISAIGQPEQFYQFLNDYDIKEKISFDDHHMYNEDEIPTGFVVTTEKDAVKMQNFASNDIYALKLKTVLDIENLLN